MTRMIRITAAVLTLAAFGPVPVAAQSLCGVREAVVEMLGARYGETVRSIGVADRNRIVEVYASDETGSWTILVTNASGVACLVASGQHYEAVMAGPRGEPL